MKKATAILALVLVIITAATESSAEKLADLIPGLYNGDGITVAPPSGPFPSHAAHFAVDTAASINQLNQQIATETGFFPFSSSVGGFTFEFDKELGTFVRTSETLGPLFAERAPTLGRGKWNLSYSFTYLDYHEFGGESLDHLQVTARHDADVLPPPDVRTSFELDTIRINVDADIRIRISSLAATYGMTDRLDIGIVLPVASVDLDVKGAAQVMVSPLNPFPGAHTFVGGPESPDDSASGDSSGLGDLLLRAKYHLLKSSLLDVGGAVLAKLETGDEKNFLGTGTTNIRPFLILSRTFFDNYITGHMFTPHLNIGYEFNLNRNDQSSLEYAAGFDVGTQTLTLAGDVIGSHELHGDGIGDDIVNGSLGLKWNPINQFLLTVNVQAPLNEAGLRSRATPTWGIEYGF